VSEFLHIWLIFIAPLVAGALVRRSWLLAAIAGATLCSLLFWVPVLIEIWRIGRLVEDKFWHIWQAIQALAIAIGITMGILGHGSRRMLDTYRRKQKTKLTSDSHNDEDSQNRRHLRR
jgi:putative effector of murein hydrolase LrgA (UPF0299 family)